MRDFLERQFHVISAKRILRTGGQDNVGEVASLWRRKLGTMWTGDLYTRWTRPRMSRDEKQLNLWSIWIFHWLVLADVKVANTGHKDRLDYYTQSSSSKPVDSLFDSEDKSLSNSRQPLILFIGLSGGGEAYLQS